MKISNELVEELTKEIVGNKAAPLILLIKEKGTLGEFKLAEKLKLTVNQVRSILYDLSSHSLVTFTRKKDKKKGWYNYFWSLNERRALELILSMKRQSLEILKKRLDIESHETFYKCPSGCIRMTLENAMESQFKCPECGSVLEEQKHIVNIESTNKQIKKLEDEIGELGKISFVVEEKPKKKEKKKKPKKAKKIKKKAKKKKIKKVKKIKRLKKKAIKKKGASKKKKKIIKKGKRKFTLKKLKKVFNR